MIIYIILLLLLIFIIKDMANGFRLSLLAHMDDDKMDINIKYLYPFLKIQVEINENVPFLLVHVLNFRVYKGRLISKGRSEKSINLMRLIKLIEYNDMNVTASYGFNEPSSTGIVCGAIGAIAAHLNIENLNQYPDFLATDMYMNVNANCRLNLGHTIINYIKNKKEF